MIITSAEGFVSAAQQFRDLADAFKGSLLLCAIFKKKKKKKNGNLSFSMEILWHEFDHSGAAQIY